jgi:hypothetical protein
MQGVVSLLDARHWALVENLWAELAHDFGVRGVSVTPYPHFSYQIAPHYDPAALAALLAPLARQTAPFRVRATGLGIFTGIQPVLYIPVVRDPALTRLHEALWRLTAPVAAERSPHYEPLNWMPHITLGHGDLTPEILPAIVRNLASHDFNWKITVDNLAFIGTDGEMQQLQFRLLLEGE